MFYLNDNVGIAKLHKWNGIKNKNVLLGNTYAIWIFKYWRHLSTVYYTCKCDAVPCIAYRCLWSQSLRRNCRRPAYIQYTNDNTMIPEPYSKVALFIRKLLERSNIIWGRNNGLQWVVAIFVTTFSSSFWNHSHELFSVIGWISGHRTVSSSVNCWLDQILWRKDFTGMTWQRNLAKGRLHFPLGKLLN